MYQSDYILPPKQGQISQEEYEKILHRAENDRQNFWAEVAKEQLDWDKEFTKVDESILSKDEIEIKWFSDGRLSACYNAVDRNAKKQPNKKAIIWESDCGTQSKTYTYSELKVEVERAAMALKNIGVTKGDRVVIYMPMIPEAVFMILACSRIGAIHCVVFGGFSSEALRDRINSAEAEFVVTADAGIRGGKIIPLKDNVDKALEGVNIKKLLVVEHQKNTILMNGERDVYYHKVISLEETYNVPCEIVESEHPLFILYTSGSTGKPKGLLHTTGGYCTYTSYTHKLVFDLKDDDIYFCTADIGWITGHSYLTYAPLINGSTVLMFEGVPTYPNAGRFWQICEKHKVTIFYTAPTALRSLMGYGLDFVKPYDLSSLRVLGTVGEPINPDVWGWYYENIGHKNCSIVDTWWQTETGGFMISSVAGTTSMRAGYAGKPLPAILPKINENGHLLIAKSWCSQARTVWGDHERFKQTYFNDEGYYITGDGAVIDEQGYIQITGRTDDVLNVSGHRLGTAEIESALVEHPSVSEAAVVGFPHDIKGQGIYAYVTLMKGIEANDNLFKDLKDIVRQKIGAIASVDKFHITTDMPKTRSGKIMRRILRKIAENECDSLGDISTLANPEIVEEIIKTRVA